jgi:hypothetical protein
MNQNIKGGQANANLQILVFIPQLQMSKFKCEIPLITNQTFYD